MRIRRTCAKRGQSPLYYIEASTQDEISLLESGRWPDQSPDARWTRVLAWGFTTYSAAAEELERLKGLIAETILRM